MNGGGKRHKNLNWLPRRVSVWECPPPSLPPFASPSLFPTLAEVLRPTSMRGVPVLVALFAIPSLTLPSAVSLSLLDSFRSRCRRWRCRWRRRSRISVFAFHFALYFSFLSQFLLFFLLLLCWLALTLTLLFLLLALSFSPSSSCDFA